MFISDDEKPGRKQALHKLMSMMSDKTGERLSSLRRKEEADEGFQDDDDNSNNIGPEDESDYSEDSKSSMGLSEEEKEKIKALYHKYCA